MTYNPLQVFFQHEPKGAPILLSVTPPRTGERTLLGVANMLQSLAMPEPFSLELVSDNDGVRLMVRCMDRALVRQQLAAHYPQARINEIPPSEDPAYLKPGERGWSTDLSIQGAPYLPLRTFRDDDLLDPGSDPLIAIIGALSNLNPGERVTSRLMLRALGPDWSRPYQSKAHERPDLVLRETASSTTNLPSMPVIILAVAAAVGFRGYLWYQQGDFLKLALLGAAVLAGGALARFLWTRFLAKPQDNVHDPQLISEKVTQAAFNAQLQITAVLPDHGTPERAEAILRTVAGAYLHYNHPAGAGFRIGKMVPASPSPVLAPSISKGLFSKAGVGNVLGVREVASLWHPPGGRDETPLMHRSGAKSLLPIPEAVRTGALVGYTTSDRPTEIRFADDLLQRHHLYIAGTRMGKTTLAQHCIAYKLEQKALGLSNDAIIVIDPHADMVKALLEQIPWEIVDMVRLIDLADDSRFPGINLLDTRVFTDRDRTADSVVRIAKGLWEQWGPRMQSILEHVIKTLHEANSHPSVDPSAQYTILDASNLLLQESFRNEVLQKVDDPDLLAWWARDFGGWRPQYRTEALAPVQTRLAYYASSKRARAILGQPTSTIDIRQTIRDGGILLVSTSQGVAGRDVSSLVGASIMNVVDAVIREQESLRPEERRNVLVMVDEFQSIVGVDYESMLSELGKYGASIMLATQNLARLNEISPSMQNTLIANNGCLVVFQVSSEDARRLVGDLGRDKVSEEDITSLSQHHCYVRATVGKTRLDTYSMMLRPPEPGNAEIAAYIRAAARKYTTSAEEIAASRTVEAAMISRYRRESEALGSQTPHIDPPTPPTAAAPDKVPNRRTRSRRSPQPETIPMDLKAPNTEGPDLLPFSDAESVEVQDHHDFEN